MKLRGLYVGLLIGLVFLLSGCGEEKATASEEVWMPVGVENGTVDEDFYLEVIRFYEESNEMDVNQQKSIIEIDPSNGRMTDIDKRKEINREIKEYDTFLDSFDFSPDTEAEIQIAELVEKSIAKRKEINKLIDVSVSLNDKMTYGLLLGDQEELKSIDNELENLLLRLELGKEQ